MDVAPVNKAAGIALTFTLLPLMALVIFRRRVWAAFISVIAFLFWLFIGIVGQGINFEILICVESIPALARGYSPPNSGIDVFPPFALSPSSPTGIRNTSPHAQ